MATLRVVAVPDFGQLNNAIKSLNTTPIKIPVDSSPIKEFEVVADNAIKTVEVTTQKGTRTISTYNLEIGKTLVVVRELNEETNKFDEIQRKVVIDTQAVIREQKRVAAEKEREEKAAAKAVERQEKDAARKAAAEEKAAEKSRKAWDKAYKSYEKWIQSFETAYQRRQELEAQWAAEAERLNAAYFAGQSGQAYTPTKMQMQIEYATGVSGLGGKSAAESAAVFEKAFSNLDDKAQKTEKSVASAGKAVKETGEELKKTSGFADLMGASFGKIVAKMALWQILGDAISKVRRTFSEALDTMKAVDDELVTVRKVTGATAEELEKIEAQAYRTASAYGVAVDAYLESVAAFARAGYKEQSADLAELSTKTQIVGDVAADTANQFLLAVDAAYKLNGEIKALNRVLDGANEIDNKYATSIEKISEGLGIVAPVAAQVHVDIGELTAAIGTITAVTQRGGSEAARALRAIFLNIVGDTKTEIDEGVTWTTGEIAGLQDVIRLYAKDAYDAAQATGKVIDPMEAIAGLAKSMKDGVLSEQQLINMVSDIGGKLRTSQLLAIIQNWDMYESMLEDYKNAYGSADKEVENALDSWTRKTNQVKNAWTEFINNIVDTSVIKGALDGIISALDTINNLLENKDPAQKYSDEIDELNKELEELETREGTLTSVEEKRLGIIRATIEELKRQRKAELEKSFDKWNTQNGYGLTFYTNTDKPGKEELVTKDVYDLRKYNEEIKSLSDRYHDARISQEEYIESLRELNGKYASTVSTLQNFKDENQNLSAAQNGLISTFVTTENIINRLIESHEKATSAAVDYASALLQENYEAGKTKEKLYEVTAKTIAFNNTELNVSQKVAALRYLAQQAGVTAAYISGVMNTGALANWVDSEMHAGNTQEQAISSYFQMISRHIANTAEVNPNSYGYTPYVAPQSNDEDEKKGGGSSPGKSEAEKAQEQHIKDLKQAASQAKKEAKEARDEAVAEIQAEIDALKKRNEEEKEAVALEEKRAAVLKAQNELEKAKNQRTYRVWNKNTRTWESVADATKVQSAEEALEKAKSDLAEYRRQQEQEAEIAALEARKKAIDDLYQKTTQQIDDALAALDEPVGNLSGLFSELGVNMGDFKNALAELGIVTEEVVEGVEQEAGAGGGGGTGGSGNGLQPVAGTYTVDPSTGKYIYDGYRRKDDDPDVVLDDGEWEEFHEVHDLGGVLHGTGSIKATARDEIVVPPNIADKMLAPSADATFQRRMSELSFIYGGGSRPESALRSGVSGNITNNNGATYNLGGITLTEQQAKTTTVYQLAQLAHGLKCYS